MAGYSSQLELVVAGLEHLRKLGVGVFLWSVSSSVKSISGCGWLLVVVKDREEGGQHDQRRIRQGSSWSWIGLVDTLYRITARKDGNKSSQEYCDQKVYSKYNKATIIQCQRLYSKYIWVPARPVCTFCDNSYLLVWKVAKHLTCSHSPDVPRAENFISWLGWTGMVGDWQRLQGWI